MPVDRFRPPSCAEHRGGVGLLAGEQPYFTLCPPRTRRDQTTDDHHHRRDPERREVFGQLSEAAHEKQKPETTDVVSGRKRKTMSYWSLLALDRRDDRSDDCRGLTRHSNGKGRLHHSNRDFADRGDPTGAEGQRLALADIEV